MPQGLYLIDERGDLLPVADLQRWFGSTRRTPDQIAAFAVAQMGAISLEVRQFALLVTLEEATVSHLALIELMDVVAKAPGKRLVVTVLHDPTRQQLLENRGAALRFIASLLGERDPKPRFWRSPTALSQSHFGAQVPLIQALLASPLRHDEQFRMVKMLLSSSLISINALDETSGHVRMVSITDHLRRYDPGFVEAGHGKTYHDLHDRELGRWSADALAAQAIADVPLSEAIDVKASAYDGSNVHRAYQRLMLPFRRDGQRMLLVASEIGDV